MIRIHYLYACVATVLLGAFLYAYSPSEYIQIGLLLIFAGLIGTPHGLTDFALLHVFTRRLGLQGKLIHLKVIGGLLYFVIFLLYLQLWSLAPLWALMIFLAMTVWHFGEHDSEAHRLTGVWMPFHTIMRGGMIILLPYLSHPETSIYFNYLSDSNIFPKTNMHLQHIVITASFFILISALAKNKYYILETLLFSIIFTVLPPLMSFTLYFCLWHTPRHYIHIQTDYNKKNILSLISVSIFFALLCLIIAFYFSSFLESQIFSMDSLQIFFRILSALTFSHVLLSLSTVGKCRVT